MHYRRLQDCHKKTKVKDIKRGKCFDDMCGSVWMRGYRHNPHGTAVEIAIDLSTGIVKDVCDFGNTDVIPVRMSTNPVFETK